MRTRFSDCLLDSETRKLLRGGKPVHLSPKAFELIELLPAEAVSKPQIHERLWPKTFVADSTLTKLAAEARAAVGDDAREPRFIRNVHVFGYAFCGNASDGNRGGPASGTGGCFYRLVGSGHEVNLEEGENILGRGPESVLWIDDESVFRRHARIRISGDAATLEDLGSKNGTYLREKKLESPSPLSDGDDIRLGAVRCKLRVFRGLPSTKSAAEEHGRSRRAGPPSQQTGALSVRVPGWAPTRSSRRWRPQGWEKSSWRSTRGSSVMSR
jgi:DNA-binding winged helix-turn-helix (wHTH) protein